MGLSSLGFLMRESLLNIRRNGLMSLAALGTVTVAMTVLGATLWSAYRLHEIAKQEPQAFNEIAVFLHGETAREKTLALQTQIAALPEVRAVHLVTKEQAWAHLQHESPALTAALEANPLMDKLEVEARDANQIPTLSAMLRDTARFPDIEQVNDAGGEARSLFALARLVRLLGGGISLALFAATLFIVQNTIRLTVFARRREIRIMQLVGATPRFIRLPLLLEGLFYGVTGGLLASGLLWLAAREVSRFVQQIHSPLIGDVPSQLSTMDALSGLVGTGALIGLIGSALALRRFLRQA